MKNIYLTLTNKPSGLGFLSRKGKKVFNDLRLFEKLISLPNIFDNVNIHHHT